MAYRIPGEGVSDRFRNRLERAQKAQEAQERAQHEKVSRQIAHRRFWDDMDRWAGMAEYDLYLIADVLLDRLKKQRDDNAPKGPDDEWNEAFRDAIELIPEAKMFLDEMSIAIIDRRR